MQCRGAFYANYPSLPNNERINYYVCVCCPRSHDQRFVLAHYDLRTCKQQVTFVLVNAHGLDGRFPCIMREENLSVLVRLQLALVRALCTQAKALHLEVEKFGGSWRRRGVEQHGVAADWMLRKIIVGRRPL